MSIGNFMDHTQLMNTVRAAAEELPPAVYQKANAIAINALLLK